MVERRRQQEAAERQRAIDAAKEAASEAEPTGFDDQDEDGFDLREVGLKSRIYSYYWLILHSERKKLDLLLNKY